jgi:hypothetical protein
MLGGSARAFYPISRPAQRYLAGRTAATDSLASAHVLGWQPMPAAKAVVGEDDSMPIGVATRDFIKGMEQSR